MLGKTSLMRFSTSQLWGGEGDVGKRWVMAAAAGQHGDGAARPPLDDDGTRVAFVREGATPPACCRRGTTVSSRDVNSTLMNL